MVKVYVSLINKWGMTLEEVPEKWRDEVRLVLYDMAQFSSDGKKKAYKEALIGLLEDTIDSSDYETAYSDDQREAFEWWLSKLKSNANLR